MIKKCFITYERSRLLFRVLLWLGKVGLSMYSLFYYNAVFELCLVFFVIVKYFFFYPSLEFQGWHLLPLKCLF